MWQKFADFIVDATVKFPATFTTTTTTTSANQSLSALPPPSQCAVTFVSRGVTTNAYNISPRNIINLDALIQIAESHNCTTQVVELQKLPSISEQIFQLRFNTTLLVGTDGTGLLNAVWMHACR